MESSFYAAGNDSGGGSIPWNKYSDESIFYHKNTTPRTVVGITCTFSMIGALLIILSYCISKKLRSQCRLILVHLSLMDFGAALANFIGVVVDFNPYYINALHDGYTVSNAVRISCVSDAFLACFCTNSSVLWTLSVAVYLHFRIVTDSHRSERFYRILLYFMYIINYGLPLFISLWMVFTHRLGFAPYDATGWCTIIVYKSKFMSPLEGMRHIDKLAAFFGSDMLIMVTIILIPFLYWSISSHARRQLSSVVTENKSNLKNKLHSLDLKFAAIPLFFILLRIWSLILGIIYDYIGIEDTIIPSAVNIILLYLAGIGDSGQGAANGIIFVIFTKKARQTLNALCCFKCCENVLEIDDESNHDVHDTGGSTIRDSIDEENRPMLTNSSSHQRYHAGGQTLYIIQSH